MTKVALICRESALIVGATLALVLLMLALSPGLAGATFPGINGKISLWGAESGGALHSFPINSDGSGLTEIGGFGYWADHARWSPDGTRFAAFLHRSALHHHGYPGERQAARHRW